MTVAPGCLASSRAAISAVSADGLTGWPRSSTTKQRSASPSNASPMSALLGDHPRLQVAQVLRLDRVRLVVGEGAVELEVHRDHVERQPVEDDRHGVPAHPVARVDDDLQRADLRQVDEIAQVGRIRGQGVALRDRAARPVVCGDRVLLDHASHVREPGVLADRGGVCAAQLDAVVLRRVVARGEHRAGDAERAGGEVETVGGLQADLDHIGAVRRGAVGERADQLGPEGRMSCPTTIAAHVVAAGSQHLDERRPDQPGQLGVELVGHRAPHVVCLDHGGQVAHVAHTICASLADVGARRVRCSDHDGTRPRDGRS